MLFASTPNGFFPSLLQSIQHPTSNWIVPMVNACTSETSRKAAEELQHLVTYQYTYISLFHHGYRCILYIYIACVNSFYRLLTPTSSLLMKLITFMSILLSYDHLSSMSCLSPIHIYIYIYLLLMSYRELIINYYLNCIHGLQLRIQNWFSLVLAMQLP